MTDYVQWATEAEVEEHLNGNGVEGAVWVLVLGDPWEGTAQFDLAIPIWEDAF